MCTCNSQAACEYGLCYPGSHPPVAQVFQWFQWLEKCFHETGSVTLVAHMNADCPWNVRTPTNEGAITAAVERAVEKLMQCHMRIWSIPTEGPHNTSWWSVASIALLVERTSVSRWLSYTEEILRFAVTPTHCRWALFTLHSVDRWSMFSHEGVFSVHNNQLWAWDNPYAVHKYRYLVLSSISIWAGIIRDVVVVCRQLDCSTVSWFSGNICQGCLKMRR